MSFERVPPSPLTSLQVLLPKKLDKGYKAGDRFLAEEQERKARADEPIQGLEGAGEPDRDWEDDSIEGLEGGNERDAEWEDDSIEGLEYED